VDGFEVQLRRADGSTMWALLSARAIAVAGEPALLVTATDISERRASETELEEREQRFRAVAEGVPLAVTIVRNEPAEILFANARACESFGLRAGDGAAAVHAVYVDPADRRALVDQLERIGRIDGFEAQLRRADGSTIWALLSAREITFHGAPAMLTAVTEISDLKVMEQALRDSEARLAAFMENAPVGMYLKDRAGRYTLTNPEMSEVFARPAHEMLGLTAADTLAGHDLDGVLRHDREVLESGRVVVVEEHTPALDAYSWSLVIRFPVRNDDGEITHIGGFHVDITERKRIEAELDRQSALLHQNEKLSALGSLLAGVAHELNNPLSLVVGYAGLLEEMAPDDATRERAVKVRIAADRCARIVRTFLAMARNKPRAPVSVQLNEVAEAALEIVAYGLRTADIEVERGLAPDLAPVHGDADQLHQVLANLLVNAQQALQTVPPPRRLRIASGEDGEAVWLAVADNGPGIPATIASRIFEPFFTTKPQGVGTGVGLAVSHGIVAAHGGRILVESEPGGGSTFTVRLPRSRLEPQEQAAVDPPGNYRRARILVVDDEPEIGDLLTDLLEGDGHETASASSGREALEWLSGREVDLIISDLRMPDMDGPTLYRALAERRPELLTRLVFITGDTLAADITGFLSETGAKVIEKPLDPPEVSRKVQALLADDELSTSPPR
jgi:PAS domain S-box-containing protein